MAAAESIRGGFSESIMKNFHAMIGVMAMSLILGCGSQSSRPGSVLVDSVERSDPSAPSVEVDNPQYLSWASFKKGTQIEYRMVTTAHGREGTTTTTTIYTLIERQAEFLEIEMRARTDRYDGAIVENPPEVLRSARRVKLPPGVLPEHYGVQRDSAPREPIVVAGKAYPTRYSQTRDRNEAGEVEVQTWTSPEVPGGLVRSVTNTPAIGKTTTLTLVRVTLP